MLGPKVADHRVRNVTFKEFCGPPFPIAKEALEGIDAARPGMSSKKFRSSRWRTSTSIKQDDVNFTTGKRLIDHRQITNNEREETES